MDKREVIYALGALSKNVGEDRLKSGNEAAARDLFRDSARKYVHRAIEQKDNTRSELRVLDRAIESAVRSEDHALSFEIAMGSTKILNGGEYVPNFGLANVPSGIRASVEGIRNVFYWGPKYRYEVCMSNSQLDEIIRLSEVHEGLMQLLQTASRETTTNVGTITREGRAGAGINIKYVATGRLCIWSDSTGGGEVESEFINALGDTLELIIGSSQINSSA